MELALDYIIYLGLGIAFLYGFKKGIIPILCKTIGYFAGFFLLKPVFSFLKPCLHPGISWILQKAFGTAIHETEDLFPITEAILNASSKMKEHVLGYVQLNIDKAADIIIYALAFFLISVVMQAIVRATKIVNRIPVIGILDRIGGGILNVLLGIVCLWIIYALVYLLYVEAHLDAPLLIYLYKEGQNGSIFAVINKFNFIIRFLTGVLS